MGDYSRKQKKPLLLGSAASVLHKCVYRKNIKSVNDVEEVWREHWGEAKNSVTAPPDYLLGLVLFELSPTLDTADLLPSYWH